MQRLSRRVETLIRQWVWVEEHKKAAAAVRKK